MYCPIGLQIEQIIRKFNLKLSAQQLKGEPGAISKGMFESGLRRMEKKGAMTSTAEIIAFDC